MPGGNDKIEKGRVIQTPRPSTSTSTSGNNGNSGGNSSSGGSTSDKK